MLKPLNLMNNEAVNCDSPVFNQSLLSADEALEFLLDASTASEKKESVSLDNSLGRILASDIHSTINVPGFDNSAMDGYAIALNNNQLLYYLRFYGKFLYNPSYFNYLGKFAFVIYFPTICLFYPLIRILLFLLNR